MLAWASFNLSTGTNIADLPGFVPQYPIRRSLCRYETATADFYLDGAPLNWQAAIAEGSALLACWDDDDDSRAIQWAGYVTSQTRDSDKDSVGLSLVTSEGYTDRRYTGTRTYTAEDQGAILTDLVTNYAATTAARPGLPLTVQLGDTGGFTRDFKWLDADNVTLYGRLQQLAAILDGLEWCIDWQWNSTGDGLAAVLKAATRLGTSAPAGQKPRAAFEFGSGGSVMQVVQTRSYADQQGANVVQTYSSGQGATAPTSGPVVAADWQGRPAFDLRYQPVSSETSTSTLLAYAQKALAVVGPGYRATALKAALGADTRHGGTWSLGDDLYYNADPVPMFPDGLSGVARAIGYELSEVEADSSIAPVLLTPELPTDGSNGDEETNG